jgi:hypothetical protein
MEGGRRGGRGESLADREGKWAIRDLNVEIGDRDLPHSPGSGGVIPGCFALQ